MNKRRLRAALFVMVFLSSLFYVFNTGNDVHAVSMNNKISVINDYSSRYNYNFLNDEQKKAYDELEKKFIDTCYYNYDNSWHLECVSLTIFDMSYETVNEIAQAFQMDHYYLYWTYTYCYSTGNANVLKVIPNSRYNMYSDNDIKKQYNDICTITSEILKEVSKYSTDEQKAYYIYTWLTENATYAYDENGEPSEKPIDHSMYGNIVNKTSVCEGFAEAFSYLCTACGIENTVVVGDAVRENGDREAHAWNIVKLSGKYYLVDTTWDEARTPENYLYAFKALDDEHFNSTHDPNRYYNQPGEEESSEEDLNLKTVKDSINNTKTITKGIYGDISDAKIKVYNNGVEVPLVDNKITVMSGTEIKLVGTDSRQYTFTYEPYINFDRYEIENGVLILNESIFRIYVSIRKPRITGFKLRSRIENYTATSTSQSATVYILSDADPIEKYLNFDITLDDKTKERADALKEIDAFIPSSFDENKLAGERVYKLRYTKTNAEADGYDTTVDIPSYELSLKYENNCILTLVNQNGVEAKAYTEEGRRVYSGTKVPYGTHILLEAVAEDGEAEDKFFYSDSKEKNLAIDGKGFVITENTTISCENSFINIKDIDYEDKVKVKNGTLPNPNLLGLSTTALVKTEEGLKKTYPITWDLSNYDYKNKSEHEVTVTGVVGLKEGTYTLKEGLSINVEATLKVSEAKDFKSLETEIPSELTVPAGTGRNPYSLGLPIAAEFKNKDGDIVLSEIEWTAGEGSPYDMTGTVKRNGYSFDPIVVRVNEVGEIISLIPDAQIDYSINNKIDNTLTPLTAESIIAHISVQSIIAHKNRNIKVHIPEGFTEVGVANAALLDGINSSKVIANEDGTADVYVEVDDSFKDGYLNFDVSFKSIFNNNSEIDTGRLYPSFSDIPISVNYKADEEGTTKNIDIDYKGKLKLAGGSQYMAEPAYTGYLNISCPTSDYDDYRYTPNYRVLPSKYTSYLKNYKIIYPLNESFIATVRPDGGVYYGDAEFDEATNSMVYQRFDNNVYRKYANYENTQSSKECVRYELKFVGDKLNTGITYSSDKNVYAIGEDYFGNEYIRVFEKKMSIYLYPYDENSNVSVTACKFGIVDEKTDLFNFDFEVQAWKSITQVSLKPINDMKLKIKIPDGTTVAGITDASKLDSVEFIYHDGTSKVIKRLSNYDSVDTDGRYMRDPWDSGNLFVTNEYYNYIHYFPDDITRIKTDGIKEMIISYNKIDNGFKSNMRLVLAGTNTYPDGKRVDYGTQFRFTGEYYQYETDCPVSDMPFKLHTEYGEYTALSKTIHMLSSEYNYQWYAGSGYDRPYKSLLKNDFTGYDIFEAYETSTGYISGRAKFKDIILTSDFINDPEVFNIKSLDISTKEIYLDNTNDFKIKVKYTDGNTCEYDYLNAENGYNSSITAPEGVYITDYIITIDELEAEESNHIEVVKHYSVNWDKFTEKGYTGGKAYVANSVSGASRDTVGSEFGKGEIFVESQITSKYNTSYYNLEREYDNKDSEAITAISSFVQSDGCTETFQFTYLNNFELGSTYIDFGISMPVFYDEIVIGVNTGTKELIVTDNEMPKLYDIEGNVLAVADRVDNTQALNKIYFKNITLNDKEKYYTVYRLEPTSYISAATYTTRAGVISLKPNVEINNETYHNIYPGNVHTDYRISNYSTSIPSNNNYNSKLVDVLITYSENATMYGKTAACDDKTASSYNVDAKEKYNAVLHMFARVESKLNGFETIINVPKSGSKLMVNGKTYENQYDSIFSNVAVTSGVINPKYYYLKDSDSEYVEFNGKAADVENPEDIAFIKVTADKVNNNSEITLSLVAPETNSEKRTYIYSDITYNDGTRSIKTIKSNVVEYVLGAGLIAEPTPTPSIEPTPTGEPTPEITPTEEPTPEITPTAEPTPSETPEPSSEPTPSETPEPTPTGDPLGEPTPEITPSSEPTPSETPEPSSEPTPSETPEPSSEPTPTATPTATPTEEPTPTAAPTAVPTEKPTPTAVPTEEPKEKPTPEVKSTEAPTEEPTETPTIEPTSTSSPTEKPTEEIVTKDGSDSGKKVKNDSSKKQSKDKTSIGGNASSDTNTASQATVDANGNTSGSSKAVSTGDPMYIIPIILVMLFSIAGIVLIILYKMKNEE